MSISFLTTGLLTISVATNLTVEGIKKLLDGSNLKYSSNLLAVITAVILAIVFSSVYLILNDIAFTLKIGVEIGVLMYLSFLTSTVGYDKVVQMFNQINVAK